MQKHALTLIAAAAIALAMAFSPFSTAQSPSDASGNAPESSGAVSEYAVYPLHRLADVDHRSDRLEAVLNGHARKGFEFYKHVDGHLIFRKTKHAGAPSSDGVSGPT